MRRRAAWRCSWRSGSRPRWPASGPPPPIIADVDPGDRQDAGAAPGRRRRPAPMPSLAAGRRPPGGRAGTAPGARATPIGPMPGPPPPCGMQKVLCRLRWQTSAPMLARPAEADLGVHVGAVHVDLAAVLRGRSAQMSLDPLLEHAVGGGVGDHQRGERGRVLLRPWPRGRRGRCCRASSQATTTTSHAGHHAPTPGWCRARTMGIRQTLRWPSPRLCVIARGSPAGRRIRPASRRWAAARRRRSR